MTRFNDKELEKLLTAEPPAEPPAELAQRIKEEIPDDLLPVATSLADDSSDPATISPPANRAWWHSRRSLALAATLMLALGGALFYVRHQQDLTPESVETKRFVFRESPNYKPSAAETDGASSRKVADYEAAEKDPTSRSDDAAPVLKDELARERDELRQRLASLGYVDSAPSEGSQGGTSGLSAEQRARLQGARLRSRARIGGDGQVPTRQQREDKQQRIRAEAERIHVGAGVAADPAPSVAEELVVTSEAPMLDERAGRRPVPPPSPPPSPPSPPPPLPTPKAKKVPVPQVASRMLAKTEAPMKPATRSESPAIWTSICLRASQRTSLPSSTTLT